MQKGDVIQVKATGNIETIEEVTYDTGYRRYGLYQVYTVSIETERGVYLPDEVEPYDPRVPWNQEDDNEGRFGVVKRVFQIGL